MTVTKLDRDERTSTGVHIESPINTKYLSNEDVYQPPCPKQPKVSNENISLLSNEGDTDLLCEIPNIVTKAEADALVYSLDKGMLGKQWALEGYDRQNRVQRYHRADNDNVAESNDDDGSSIDEHSMEESFGWIFDRIISASSQNLGSIIKHRPYEVIVTEHTPSSCRSIVDVFEEFQLCPCRQKGKDCTCYIAQLTLVNSTIQHVEKPEIRDLECWDVAAAGEIMMEENGAIIKMGESLWNWRGRIMDVQEKTSSEYGSDGNNSDTLSNEIEALELNNKGKKKKGAWVRTKKLKALNKRSITITFRGIHPLSPSEHDDNTVMDLELLAKRKALANRPLAELLTIIITTSPIRSNPSTEMLEHTFDTFQLAGNEFAFECKKVIVCDGCRVLEELKGDDDSDPNAPPKIRIYANGKQNLRNGVATSDQLKNYREFKAALHNLCAEANNSRSQHPFQNTQVVELEERHGYGFALRHALRHCVDTPYVCVIQHDRNFVRETPVKEVVKAIICDPQIKYVGMNMRSNLMYYDIFSGKYGKRAIEEFKTLVLRPKELCIGGNKYGPHGESINTMPIPFKSHRSVAMNSLREAYKGSHQNLIHLDWLESKKSNCDQNGGYHQLSLTPILFWYDNTHIVETAHYRDFIFNPKYKMVARGGFVEDKLSPVITRNVERLGLKMGHARFGCYLLDDHSGMFFTGHLDGGSYKTAHLHHTEDKKDTKTDN